MNICLYPKKTKCYWRSNKQNDES